MSVEEEYERACWAVLVAQQYRDQLSAQLAVEYAQAAMADARATVETET